MSLFGIVGWLVYGGMAVKDSYDTSNVKGSSKERAMKTGAPFYSDGKGHIFYTPTGERVFFTSEGYYPDPSRPHFQRRRNVLVTVRGRKTVYRYPTYEDNLRKENEQIKENHRKEAIEKGHRYFRYFNLDIGTFEWFDLEMNRVCYFYPQGVKCYMDENGEKIVERISREDYLSVDHNSGNYASDSTYKEDANNQ